MLAVWQFMAGQSGVENSATATGQQSVAAWQTGNMTISLRMMTIREASEADADSFFASYFLIMQHGCRCECGSVICKQYNHMCLCVCVCAAHESHKRSQGN